LALCSSTEDISEEIGQDGIHITLAALQDYLPKGEDPPSFLSRSYLYMKEGQIPPPSLLKTSAKEDTNLPDLAEIYYLYYDVCVDRPSEFNKADRKYWKAFKGRFQFCLQTLSSERPDASTSPQIMYDKADLDWYKTTKFNETAFCTKVESEKEDFCVSESVMESLSTQLNSFFNATAFFNDSNRETIRYSSEYGPILTHDIFGGTRDTMPFCGTMFSSRPANGWSNPDPYGHYGLPGFSDRLRSVADSLNFAYATLK
jgi:hypothetical protein